MIEEEEIIRTLKNYREKAISFHNNSRKQKQLDIKRDRFLQKIFQQDPQLIVNLFWNYYEKWMQFSEQERYNIHRYSDELFWAIIASIDQEAIEVTSKIMLKSNDLYKEEAARFLGDTREAIAVPYLIEGLKSEDYRVVSESALALGSIGDLRAESHLLEIVDRYDNDEAYSDAPQDNTHHIIRYNTFIGLCLLNTSAARQKILQSLMHDRDTRIQLRAIRYLVAETPKEATAYLEELSKSNNDDVSTLAKEFLEELNPNH